MITVALTVPSCTMNRSALRGDCREHVEREPGPGRARHGCASHRGPGGAGMEVGANAGLVGEVDRCPPLGLGLLADGRELLDPPTDTPPSRFLDTAANSLTPQHCFGSRTPDAYPGAPTNRRRSATGKITFPNTGLTGPAPSGMTCRRREGRGP